MDELVGVSGTVRASYQVALELGAWRARSIGPAMRIDAHCLRSNAAWLGYNPLSVLLIMETGHRIETMVEGLCEVEKPDEDGIILVNFHIPNGPTINAGG